MTQTTNSAQNGGHNFIFWITLIRGVLAFSLGFSLLFIPDKTYSMLYNFMGMFWLMSGILMVRQEIQLKRGRLFLILGISGVLTGLLVISRNLTKGWFGDELVTSLLGAVILITGILHVGYGLQYGRQAMLGRTGVSTVLGIFEIFLGGLVLFSHPATSPIVFTIATIWALLGGTLLLIDALRMRRKNQPA